MVRKRLTGWDRVIQAITAPLGFFVLALLIVEAFLATALIGGNFDKTNQVTGMWAGVGMFILVVGAVWILVWHKPENLTFDKDAHLENRRAPFGTEKKVEKNVDELPLTEAKPQP